MFLLRQIGSHGGARCWPLAVGWVVRDRPRSLVYITKEMAQFCKATASGDDLKAEEVEELRAAFKELGRDGQLETRKLGAALRALGFMPSEMHLLELTEHVSLNLGGRVTCDDFIDILIPKVLAETRGCFGPRELHLAFNQLDTNGDGLVSLPELRQALRSLLGEPLPAADVEEVLRDGDLNGDGRLDFTALIRALTMYNTKKTKAPDERVPV